MKLKEFDILLDIKRNKKIEEFEIVQGDYETNILKISLVEDFNEYDLSGLSVEIAFAKSDGTTVLQDLSNGISLTGNKIVCTFKTNTIASPGKVLAEVRVLEGPKLLTSSRFSFFVRQSIVDDKTIESTNEFPILNKMIEDVTALLNEIQSKPEIQGYSAYQVWLNQGNVGTVDDYLASLIGPQGKIGPPGPQGIQGERGLPGSIENLDSNNIIEALGYTPADTNLIGLLASLTTEQKTNLVTAINEVNDGLSSHEAEKASDAIKPHGLGNIAKEDYEEGVFTPIIKGLTVAGTNTYNIQFGRYRRIGKTVTFLMQARLENKDTNMAGAIAISGLPFNSFLNCACVIGRINAINLNDNGKGIVAMTIGNSPDIELLEIYDNAVSTAIQASQLVAGSLIAISGTYMIA